MMRENHFGASDEAVFDSLREDCESLRLSLAEMTRERDERPSGKDWSALLLEIAKLEPGEDMPEIDSDLETFDPWDVLRRRTPLLLAAEAERDAALIRAESAESRLAEAEGVLRFYSNAEVYEETSMRHGFIPACGPPIIIEDGGERARALLAAAKATSAPLPPQRAMTADEAAAYCEVLDKAFGYPSSHALRRCEGKP